MAAFVACRVVQVAEFLAFAAAMHMEVDTPPACVEGRLTCLGALLACTRDARLAVEADSRPSADLSLWVVTL